MTGTTKISSSFGEAVRRLVPNTATFDRGLQYYYFGKVDILHHNRRKNKITADVIGTFLYEVTIEIKPNNRIGYSCDCEANRKYAGPCKHVVATLLQLESDGLPLSKLINLQTDKSQLLEQFQLFETYSTPGSVEKETLAVSFELHLKTGSEYYPHNHNVNEVQLSMRVGTKRLYVVKDTFNFLQAAKEKQNYQFSSKFSYLPGEHAFSEQDEKVLDLLYILLSVEGNRMEYSAKRYIDIPSILLGQLTDLLQDCQVSLIVDDHPMHTSLKKSSLGEGEQLFQFSLSEIKGKVEVSATLERETWFPDPSAKIAIKGDKIIELTDSQAKSLAILNNAYQPNEPIDIIRKEELESFCSKVFPAFLSQS